MHRICLCVQLWDAQIPCLLFWCVSNISMPVLPEIQDCSLASNSIHLCLNFPFCWSLMCSFNSQWLAREVSFITNITIKRISLAMSCNQMCILCILYWSKWQTHSLCLFLHWSVEEYMEMTRNNCGSSCSTGGNFQRNRRKVGISRRSASSALAQIIWTIQPVVRFKPICWALLLNCLPCMPLH